MGGRDHSVECEVCGFQRGGLNDLKCYCDDNPWYLAFMGLADNLCAGLREALIAERAFTLGFELGNPSFPRATWEAGCGRPAPRRGSE